MPLAVLVAARVALTMLALSPTASAQAGPDASALPSEEAPQADLPRLPSVIESITAPYPPEALAQGLEASVLLELTLDAEGSVTEARVVEPAGGDFDEAARLALLAFRFSPALDAAGRPAAATLQYRYNFELDTLPILGLEGRLRAAGSRDGLPGLRVVATGPEGASRVAETDAEGAFQLYDLAEGSWLLDAAGAGYDAEQLRIDIEAGQVGQVTLWMTASRPWEQRRANEELVIEGDRLNPEVTQRALRADEIRRQPGSAGDIVRAIQSLPGMARSPFNAGQLLVRGTGPDDSGFYLGGSPIPLVFHFGGLATVINGDSLSEVVFLPGNYGVRYGRTLGGVIDLRTDPELPQRSGGYAAIDLFQSTLFVEQKIKDKTAVTVSGRRSYIDAVLAPLVNQESSVDIQLPRYTDVQARLLHRGEDQQEIDLLLLVSDDRFRIDGEDDDGEDLDSTILLAFQKAWLRWRRPIGSGWLTENTVMVGPERKELNFLDEESAYDHSFTASLRSEFTRPVPTDGNIGWRVGFDGSLSSRRFSTNLEDLAGYSSFADPEDGDARVFSPGLYLEQTQRAGRLEGVPGLRLDAMLLRDRDEDTDYTALAADPRLALRYGLTPATTLTGTLGRYSQFPQPRELLLGSNGNPDLRPEWALASSLGVKHAFSSRVQAEATAYLSQIYDLIVGREDRFEFRLGPLATGPVDDGAYANDGTGSIRGVETLVRYDDGRTLAWAGLTLSRSTRQKRDLDSTLFEYDQPLVATVVASRILPHAWQLGLRLRYGSGNPYHPVANRVYELEERVWVPLFTEETRRIAPWWSLDLRVDKDFVFRRWTLTTYLDLMNATNHKNQEMVNWNADYSAEVPVYGLPIIPAFGLRGSW